MDTRRHELDWMRVIAVLMLFFYHSARVFDFSGFYVKDSKLSMGAEVFVAVLDVWFPLFFFIAGASAWFALKKRSASQFASERTRRLLVPFVFGVLFLATPQVYCVYIQKPGNTASVVQFAKYLFSVPPLTEILAGQVEDARIVAYTWEMAHLWFVVYLLFFALVCIPLFSSVKDGRLRGTSDRLAGFCDRRMWGIFLFGIPMALATTAFMLPEYLARMIFIVPFALGFILYSDERFGRAIDRVVLISLVSALILTGASGTVVALDGLEVSGVLVVPVGILLGATMWAWLLTLVAGGRRLLKFTNPLLDYANDASYPFYILHQTVLVALALGIVEMSVPWPVKYCLLLVSTLVITAVTYELLVRRWRPTRFLFGMK
ncbi:MAG: acyltransferase family protein [Actinobacteria bacterium]|nr:acyltransferase family protein [Actinomycetota bacterium]